MKTKEELLKIYSSYLPYELKVKFGEFDSIYNLLSINVEGNADIISENKYDLDNIGIDGIKPILYSMDYLIKYEFRFIWENETDLESLEQCLSLDTESFLSSKFSYEFWSQLFENHFNVFGLSDSEYIKKETLNK